MSRILNVSDSASLGLHGMAVMALNDALTMKTHQVAQALNASEAHTSKVLQRLNEAGLVESVRGRSGGYRLSRKPSGVSLLEVYEAIDEPLSSRKCMFHQQLCDGSTCIFEDMLTQVHEIVMKYFRETKVSDLAELLARKLEKQRSKSSAVSA